MHLCVFYFKDVVIQTHCPDRLNGRCMDCSKASDSQGGKWVKVNKPLTFMDDNPPEY